MVFKIFFLGFKIHSDVKKLLLGHWAILSYLGFKFPISVTIRQPSFILYSKVIGLTKHELRISNSQLKIYGLIW